jgi:VIT1/CCC1 family predicted Fe2+/Mn2+ transporter
MSADDTSPDLHSSRAHTRKIEHAQSGTARAALLGISDGLVTNVSLILGIAGAGAGPEVVRLAGFASLLAGALSMAVGEYISMRGQVELLTGILETERAQLQRDPEAVQNILQDILRQDGLSPATAATASAEIAQKPEVALSVYARGRYGINPENLGSVWGSALSSLATFSAGALVPLLPWFFASGIPAIALSLAAASVAAVGIGAYLGMNTDGRWLRAGLRQLLVLIVAASLTYIIGRLFNTIV